MCARERHIEPILLDKMLDSLRQACDGGDTALAIRQLSNLVPEYRAAAPVKLEASDAQSHR